MTYRTDDEPTALDYVVRGWMVAIIDYPEKDIDELAAAIKEDDLLLDELEDDEADALADAIGDAADELLHG
jgi:hypothetical protein